ncbi:MAG TPA: hypothetical protein PLY09_02535 [Methanothrix sp.]|nr:hypothetical protein [Methanothrix sp.]HPJ83619.1 hypothetical protein [Methanothrix sp.]
MSSLKDEFYFGFVGCGVDVPAAMEALEYLRNIEGFWAKVQSMGRFKMTLADCIFYGVFDDEETALLFELEDRGYLTTGIVRLSG